MHNEEIGQHFHISNQLSRDVACIFQPGMEQHQQPFCPPGRGCSSALGRTRHCLKCSYESFWCKHPARPFLQHRSSVFRPRPASWLLHLGTGTATGVTPAGNWARDGGTGGMLGLHPGVLLDEASWCARGNCGKFPPSCIYGHVVFGHLHGALLPKFPLV